MKSAGFWGATFKKDPDGESVVSNVAGMMFPDGGKMFFLRNGVGAQRPQLFL